MMKLSAGKNIRLEYSADGVRIHAAGVAGATVAGTARIVSVYNNVGGTWAAGSLVTLSPYGGSTADAAARAEWNNAGPQPFMGALAAAAAVHFALLLDPIPYGTWGRALVDGPALVELNVTRYKDQFAVVGDASTGLLASNSYEGARIVWQSATTGRVNACVMLGYHSAGVKPYAGHFTVRATESDDTLEVVNGADPDSAYAGTVTYGSSGSLVLSVAKTTLTRSAGTVYLRIAYENGAVGASILLSSTSLAENDTTAYIALASVSATRLEISQLYTAGPVNLYWRT